MDCIGLYSSLFSFFFVFWQGFDVDVYPGLCFAAVYVPRPEFKEPCQLRTDAIEMSQLAVAQFNSDNRDSKV